MSYFLSPVLWDVNSLQTLAVLIKVAPYSENIEEKEP